MATIAPGQTNLRVMPTAALPDAQLFTQIPSATAGMQLFEQAAKLPLMMEQIKMEKMRQKSEKAKLDLAEMQANYQMQNFDKLAQQQQALADAQLALIQAQAAAAAKPAAVRATDEANAAIAQDLMARASRLGINANNYIMADTGLLDVEGLTQDIQTKAAEASIEPGPLSTAAAPTTAAPETTLPPELVSVSQRLTSLSPRAVAIQRYAADNPSMPFNLLTPAEQSKALQPYLASASPKTRKQEFLKEGDKYEATVTESADGTVTYRIDEPIRVSSAPESRATATVKTKLAFLDETDKKIDTLISHLDKYEKDGAFGWFDTVSAKWAQSPETPVPLRAVANAIGNDATKALASELAGIGAKTMTELAGSAQTKGEAERLGPYVPASTDPVLGKEELKRKLTQFKDQLKLSRGSLETQFGITTKQAPAPKEKAAVTPTTDLDTAISAYLNAP